MSVLRYQRLPCERNIWYERVPCQEGCDEGIDFLLWRGDAKALPHSLTLRRQCRSVAVPLGRKLVGRKTLRRAALGPGVLSWRAAVALAALLSVATPTASAQQDPGAAAAGSASGAPGQSPRS